MIIYVSPLCINILSGSKVVPLYYNLGKSILCSISSSSIPQHETISLFETNVLSYDFATASELFSFIYSYDSVK